MTLQKNTLKARVYFSTYEKYNEGWIYEDWLTLSAYPDKDESRQEEFLIRCDIGHLKLSGGNIDDLINDFDNNCN